LQHKLAGQIGRMASVESLISSESQCGLSAYSSSASDVSECKILPRVSVTVLPSKQASMPETFELYQDDTTVSA
jgi:hypothetical protein